MGLKSNVTNTKLPPEREFQTGFTGYNMDLMRNLRQIGSRFRIPGRLMHAKVLGAGHINNTYVASYEHNRQLARYVHQRINHHVFKDPLALMSNFERVLSHLKLKHNKADDTGGKWRVLELVHARDGLSSYRDRDGYFWRTYMYVDAASYNVVSNEGQAQAAAEAFGMFQRDMSDLPLPRLHETIPDFHNTVKRFANFLAACEADACNRALAAKTEIEFAMKRREITGVLLRLLKEGKLPERTTHNDPKLNNVLFNRKTGCPVCVIDLDTVMPGLVLYDFGDIVRSSTCTVREDERDLSRVKMRMPLFRAVARGYLSVACEFLTPCERKYLPFSGKLITFEIGLRFLTDYLSGDTYFKIHRPEHNLDRCRMQFKLVESIEQQEEEMNKFVRSCV